MATAIHSGHAVRDDVLRCMRVSDRERLREEDPYTDGWATAAGGSTIIVHASRFEFDLNRPPDKAVYKAPEDAWGIDVWREEPGSQIHARSLDFYHTFYSNVLAMLTRVEAQYGRFVVLDLHNYNHRRDGPNAEPADERMNPEVNLGTGSMDCAKWDWAVDLFATSLRNSEHLGGDVDVRRDVKFKGGWFPTWIHKTFPETGCALAIEFKKTFMNEWTGVPNHDRVSAIGNAISDAATSLRGAIEAGVGGAAT